MPAKHAGCSTGTVGDFIGMREPRLRIYYGPQEDSVTTLTATEERRETVTVPFREVVPLLAEAMQSERTWLADFQDDDVTISADLYDVMLAFQHYRRPTG